MSAWASGVGDRQPVHVRGEKGSGMSGHHLGYRPNSIEWYTPPGIINALGLGYQSRREATGLQAGGKSSFDLSEPYGTLI